MTVPAFSRAVGGKQLKKIESRSVMHVYNEYMSKPGQKQTTITLELQGKPEERHSFLTVLHSPDGDLEERLFKIPPQGVTIGRDVQEPNAVLVHDPRISRSHAQLIPDKSLNTVEIKDLGSKNGVIINNSRTRHAVVSNQDIIGGWYSVYVVIGGILSSIILILIRPVRRFVYPLIPGVMFIGVIGTILMTFFFPSTWVHVWLYLVVLAGYYIDIMFRSLFD